MGLHRGDEPSKLQFSNLTFVNWTGTSQRSTSMFLAIICRIPVLHSRHRPSVVELACSPAAPCPNMRFENINITPPSGTAPSYICVNVASEFGLPGVLSRKMTPSSH